MTYSLLLTSYALDQFGKLPTEYYVRVRDAITALAKEPRPNGCFYLIGGAGWSRWLAFACGEHPSGLRD